MRLGRRVDDHVDALDELGDEPGVADVAVDEREPLVAQDVCEVLEVPGVRERVERDHLVLGVRQEVADHVGRDEAGAAGDENALHGSARS